MNENAAAQRSSQRVWLVLFLVLAVAIPGGVLLSRWLGEPASEFARSAELGDCDLQQGACVADFGAGARAEVRVLPRPIPLVKPLKLQVTLHGIEARAVALDFAGVDMDMGFNRFMLEQTESGWTSSTAILPICTFERMLWEAQLLIETEQGVWMAPFRFWTER